MVGVGTWTVAVGSGMTVRSAAAKPAVEDGCGCAHPIPIHVAINRNPAQANDPRIVQMLKRFFCLMAKEKIPIQELSKLLISPRLRATLIHHRMKRGPIRRPL